MEEKQCPNLQTFSVLPKFPGLHKGLKPTLSVFNISCTCYKSLEYPILNSVFVSIGKNSDGRTVGHVWHAVVV